MRRALALFGVLLTTLGAVALTSSPAQAAPDYYEIESVASRKCVSNFNQSGNVYQEHCNQSPEQLWTWYQIAGTSQWRIQNLRYPTACLATENNATANGTRIILWGCNSTRATTKWYWEPRGDGRWRIRSAAVNRCIDVPWGTSDVTHLQLWDCHSGDSQHWRNYLFVPPF